MLRPIMALGSIVERMEACILARWVLCAILLAVVSPQPGMSQQPAEVDPAERAQLRVGRLLKIPSPITR